jgi:hypothetical protein
VREREREREREKVGQRHAGRRQRRAIVAHGSRGLESHFALGSRKARRAPEARRAGDSVSGSDLGIGRCVAGQESKGQTGPAEGEAVEARVDEARLALAVEEAPVGEGPGARHLDAARISHLARANWPGTGTRRARSPASSPSSP